MAEQQTVTEFDMAERARILGTLRRYMEENGIGTPTLQARIIKADTPRHREIPLSTLQRFITGSHHTQDHHVAVCHAFVKDLPYYRDEYDLTNLGNAAAEFFRLSRSADGSQPVPDTLSGDFNLRVHREPRRDGIGLASTEGKPLDEKIDYSVAAIHAQPGETHHGIRERVFNPYVVNFVEQPGQPSYLHEGVAFMTSEKTAVAFQRDMLTRQPRTIHLTRALNPSDNFPTLFYAQVIWFPFQSRPSSDAPLAQTVENLHLTSASDDTRRSEERHNMLKTPLADSEESE